MTMEKTEAEVRDKMLGQIEWDITYHTEKLAEAQLKKQILTSKYQPKTKTDAEA